MLQQRCWQSVLERGCVREKKNDMIQKENVIIIKKGKQSGTIKNYTSGLQKYSRISRSTAVISWQIRAHLGATPPY